MKKELNMSEKTSRYDKILNIIDFGNMKFGDIPSDMPIKESESLLSWSGGDSMADNKLGSPQVGIRHNFFGASARFFDGEGGIILSIAPRRSILVP